MGLLSNVVGAVQSRLKRMMGVRTEEARKHGWVRWRISGNMLTSKEHQEFVMQKAMVKRRRKMNRPGGWYNG